MSIRMFFAVIIFNSMIFAMDDAPAVKLANNYETPAEKRINLIRALEFEAKCIIENDVSCFNIVANKQMWSNYYYFFVKYYEAKQIYAQCSKRRTSLLDRSHKEFPVILTLLAHLKQSIASEKGLYPSSVHRTHKQIRRAFSKMDEHNFFALCDDLIEVSSFGLLLTRKGLLEVVTLFENNVPIPKILEYFNALDQEPREEKKSLEKENTAKDSGELKVISPEKATKKKRKFKNILRAQRICQSK